jgi:cell division protein FtsB
MTDSTPSAAGAWIHRQAELQGQIANQEQRWREAEVEWVERFESLAGERDELRAEVERLRAALEKIAEGAHGVYLTAGVGTRVSHKTIESIAREALVRPKEC